LKPPAPTRPAGSSKGIYTDEDVFDRAALCARHERRGRSVVANGLCRERASDDPDARPGDVRRTLQELLTPFSRQVRRDSDPSLRSSIRFARRRGVVRRVGAAEPISSRCGRRRRPDYRVAAEVDAIVTGDKDLLR
jgi:hypothetical protein